MHYLFSLYFSLVFDQIYNICFKILSFFKIKLQVLVFFLWPLLINWYFFLVMGHLFLMLLMSSNFHLYVKHSGHYVFENFSSVLHKTVDFYYCMLLICLIFLKLVIYFCSDRSRVGSSLGLE